MPALLVKYRYYLLFAALLVVIYFPLFLHLTYMPIRMWDESILGVNAMEMMHNHNYIVTWFDGAPDVQNCKPPLMIWLIVTGSELLGFSELSLRLPSALAALALCVYLFYALRKYTGSALFGFFAVMVLITCRGFVRNHVIRTGEYDSLLVLFSTVFALQLFFAVQAKDKAEESKHLLLFFVFLTLAVLTKGVACMMQMPGMLLYVALRKKVFSFLKNKWFYAGLGLFLVIGPGYYFLRESMSPGYLHAVWQQELGGRYGLVNQGHSGPFSFYFTEMANWQFAGYMLLFPAALLAGLAFSGSPIKKLTAFALTAGVSFLIVISAGATKLPHYDAPLFPYLAIIMASLFYLIYTVLNSGLAAGIKYPWTPVIALFLILSFFAKPYSDIIDVVYFPKGDWWEETFSVSCRIFQLAARGKEDINGYRLVFDNKAEFGTHCALNCYLEILKEHNIKAGIVSRSELRDNDTAVVFESWVIPFIEEQHNVKMIRHIDKCNADVIALSAKPN